MIHIGFEHRTVTSGWRSAHSLGKCHWTWQNIELIHRATKPLKKRFALPKGDICPPAQHFRGAKLRSEYYVLVTKCQRMLIILQFTKYRMSLRNLIKITKLAKRAIMNLSDVSRRSFCLKHLSARLWFDSRLPHNTFR